ncbi:MAG: TasA family protein [Coriobacteriia bacterium]|nr:TasA family protein [Coriobacteriia bacterium]
MRKLLWVCAGLALVWSTSGAGTYFTDRAEVADNVVRAGTVSVSIEPTSAALSIDALAPGEVVQRALIVVNDGPLAANVTVTGAKKMGITDFYNALTCRVTADGLLLYEGPMNALKTTPVRMDPATRASLMFSVGLPASAGNDLAGDYVRMTLYVDAEQVH